MKEASKQSNKHLVSKWTEFLEIVLEIITTIGFSILITKLYIYIFTVYHLIKITSGGSSLVMQCAKDPELWLQRLGSMLWHSFDPGPRTSTCLGCSQKKKLLLKSSNLSISRVTYKGFGSQLQSGTKTTNHVS